MRRTCAMRWRRWRRWRMRSCRAATRWRVARAIRRRRARRRRWPSRARSTRDGAARGDANTPRAQNVGRRRGVALRRSKRRKGRRKSHVSTFTSWRISAAEATSPWRSLSADSMRVSLARSASQYIFPSVTSQSVLSSSSLVASSSFIEVSSSCSKPCATIPVIATFDCDLRFARNCEFAIKWLQACFSLT